MRSALSLRGIFASKGFLMEKGKLPQPHWKAVKQKKPLAGPRPAKAASSKTKPTKK